MPRESIPVRLDLLGPHPDQARLFGGTDPATVGVLSASLAEAGLREPIEVVPDPGRPGRYVIVSGHHRAEAAKVLGWAEIDAVVRDDLADPLDADAYHAEANLVRRRLTTLQVLASVCTLLRVEKDRARRDGREPDRRNVIRALQDTLPQSEKNLDRYYSVASAPAAIREAFEAGHLPLADAAKAAKSPRREEIAAEIERRGTGHARRGLNEFVVKYRRHRRCNVPADKPGLPPVPPRETEDYFAILAEAELIGGRFAGRFARLPQLGYDELARDADWLTAAAKVLQELAGHVELRLHRMRLCGRGPAGDETPCPI